jgi:hypothetical protein
MPYANYETQKEHARNYYWNHKKKILKLRSNHYIKNKEKITLNYQSSNNFSSAPINNATHIANGLQRYFDDVTCAEMGFILYPNDL